VPADESPSAPPVQVVLYPAPAPQPALKYQLLTPFLERKPGNAAVWWNRLPAESFRFFNAVENEYANSGRITTWMELPLGDPREKAYRQNELAGLSFMFGHGGIYHAMERAARFESCDWELPIHEGNYIEILLPEIQQSRSYARLLAAIAHMEIAEGKYDQAVRTLQTGFAEGRHVAQAQTVIGGLVGVTIAGIMSNQVEQFIQQPDAPNLYWALSTLPRPLVDMRPGGEAELNLLYLQFPELQNLDKKQLSPEGWRDLLDKVQGEVARLEPLMMNENIRNSAKIKKAPIEEVYSRGKSYLIEHGRAAAEVEAMPQAQVVLLYSVKILNQRTDDAFKWFYLPASETGTRLQLAEQARQDAAAAEDGIFPTVLFCVAVRPAKEAETRCQWTIAVLRIFEAMRLYAASHDGQWPEHLTDITEVPLPMNPYDGKPFSYQRHGDKVLVTFSERGPTWHPRYEVMLKQKAK
jgi:hypothetical protein